MILGYVAALREDILFQIHNGNQNSTGLTIRWASSGGGPENHLWSEHGLASRKHLLHRVKDKCVPLHGEAEEKHEKQRSLVPSILDGIAGISIFSGVLALGISILSNFQTPSATRSSIAFFSTPLSLHLDS